MVVVVKAAYYSIKRGLKKLSSEYTLTGEKEREKKTNHEEGGEEI
jgi:hypothetical protein